MQQLRRGVADVAADRQRADHALVNDDRDRAAQLRTQASKQRAHLDEVREQCAELGRRENQLSTLAHCAQTDTNIFRMRKESIKAKYTAARAEATLAEVEESLDPSTYGEDPTHATASTSIPSFRELRPARLGERELRILFALQPSQTAVLLYADDTDQDATAWYNQAIPQALDRYRAHTYT